MKHETRKIRHNFTPEETAVLQRDFHQAVKNIKAVEEEFDSVKASYKAKIAEVESRSVTLSATIDAGFEMRDRKCVVLYRPKDRKKDYFAEEHEAALEKLNGKQLPEDIAPLLTEEMSDNDLQMELIEAEAKFELKEPIELFAPVNEDAGTLIVGRFGGKWFTALRVKVASRVLEERLDGEQPCFKNRPDAVRKAVKRFGDWLYKNLGKDAADGFAAGLDTVIDAHKEREE
jgi:hypothetical protein